MTTNTALCTLDAAALRLALPMSGRVEASYGPALQMYGLVSSDMFIEATPIQHRVIDGVIDAAVFQAALPEKGVVTLYATDGEFLLSEPAAVAAAVPVVQPTVTLPQTRTLTAPAPVVPAACPTAPVPDTDVIAILRRLLAAAQGDVIRYGGLCYELWLPGRQHKVMIFCGAGYTLVTDMLPDAVTTTRYRELTIDETKHLFEPKGVTHASKKS